MNHHQYFVANFDASNVFKFDFWAIPDWGISVCRFSLDDQQVNAKNYYASSN